jgi:hypothetical protein
MPTAVDFDQLTETVNDGQAKVQAAATKTRADLRALVDQAQQKAERQAEMMHQKGDQAKGQAAAGWQSVKEKWQANIQAWHRKVADKRAENDQRKAEAKADTAETYAEDAVSFAIAAAQEAEYACLDAVLARADAESLGTAG